MKSYYRLMLGRKSVHAQEAFDGCFIGIDYGIHEDLSGRLPDRWRDFNKEFIPIYLKGHPEKTKIAAGLACGSVWTVSKGVNKDDIILCPDGKGLYRVGQVLGDYYYVTDQNLPHRRKVRWLDVEIARSAMSDTLQGSTNATGAIINISVHRDEIERLIKGSGISSPIVTTDPVIEDPMAFAMEQHLEQFLIVNWNSTELSQDFQIYEEEGEPVGQQYATDVGPIDILAISKDRKRLLVVELKRGRASDVVVGQILRYMGYIKDQIAEDDQEVEGIIIALEDDDKLRMALKIVPTISFYRYQISFKLVRD